MEENPKFNFTETELRLMKWFINIGLDKDELMGTMAILRTEKIEDKMLDYLINENPEAEQKDIMKIMSGHLKTNNGIDLSSSSRLS